MKYFVSLFIYILLNNYCTYGPEITKHDKINQLGFGFGFGFEFGFGSAIVFVRIYCYFLIE